MRKNVITIKCHTCKYDRFFSQQTARQINRSPLPFVCDACIYKMNESYKKLIEDDPKWEGTTVVIEEGK
jgi:hypothetical protein